MEKTQKKNGSGRKRKKLQLGGKNPEQTEIEGAPST
jgi:hypothetical protein